MDKSKNRSPILLRTALIQIKSVFNDRHRPIFQDDQMIRLAPSCCGDKVSTGILNEAIEMAKDPIFTNLTNREICFVLVYKYYWQRYPYTSRYWLMYGDSTGGPYGFLREHISKDNIETCIEFIEKKSVYPDVAMEKYGGFDIIVIVTLHGETCAPLAGMTMSEAHDPHKAESELGPYKFTLMEAVPCGIANFNDIGELERIMDDVEFLKSDKHFLEKLQCSLRGLKSDKKGGIYQQYEDAGDQDYLNYHQCPHNFNIVQHIGGYLERVYQYREKGSGFMVAYAKESPSQIKTGDNLRPFLEEQQKLKEHPKKFPEFTRTELLTFIRDQGFTMPLIIDVTCGCFPKEVSKEDAEQYQSVAKEFDLMGGRKSRRSKRQTRKRRVKKMPKYSIKM